MNINYFKERTSIDQNGCWNWNLYKNIKGYGRCSLNLGNGKKSYLVHRLIYEHVNGEIKKGMLICHKCDNPACCNPNHLFIGTPQDNMIDMVNKGRGRNVPQYKNRYGVKHTIIMNGKKFEGFEQAGRYVGITGNGIRKRVKSGKYNYEIIS